MSKNFILTIVCSLAFIFHSKAQSIGDFEFGGNIGANLSNVTTSEGLANSNPLFSYQIGLTGEYYFAYSWGVKMKLIYDKKGWADGFLEDENFNTMTTDFELNYLTIPVMANWHFGRTKNWYLNFGPYVGFLLSAQDSESQTDLKDYLNSTDVGLALGIGHKFEINDRTHIFVEYDGQSGLTDIFEENSGSAVRMSRSSFNVGVLVNL